MCGEGVTFDRALEIVRIILELRSQIRSLVPMRLLLKTRKYSRHINFREFHAKFSKRKFKNPRKYLRYYNVLCTRVLMQMGDILENVWGLLCFSATQLLVNLYCTMYVWCQVFGQYKNIKWASAQREFNNLRICFCAAKHEKSIPRN